MSRLLAELLGADEPIFSLGLRRLEAAAGAPAEDVRLTAELRGAHRHKLARLGLDTNDTNGQELYHALHDLIGKHDELLANALARSNQDKSSLALQIKKTAEKLALPKNCWALKSTAAKRLLKSLPPKLVMKLLGYRSVDSMLKRENTAELFAALAIVETPAWQQRLKLKYQSLTSSDFETGSIATLILDQAKWGKATSQYAIRHHKSILCIPEMGIVAILPFPDSLKSGISITLLPQIIDAMQQIKLFSLYAKLKQVNVNFGSLIMTAAAGLNEPAAELHGHALSWSALQHHFGSLSSKQSLKVFEPHVSTEDFAWPATSQVVASLHQGLDYWHDTPYLGASFPDGVVSYNLLDVSLNYCNNIPYHKRIVYYLRRDLWHELFARYLAHPALQNNVLQQIETTI